MNVLFLGNQHIGASCLEALMQTDANVGLVVGHSGESSLESVAKKYGISFQLADTKPNDWNWPKDLPPYDWIVSVYFRYMIPENLLKAPKGAANIHGSLLPKYRGCAPVNWAIINGESQVGVTMHDMVATADAGCILDQVIIDVGPNDQAGDVMNRVAECAAKMIKRQYYLIKEGKEKRTPQPKGEWKIYPRRTPKDAIIDWSQPAEVIHNLIRAVNPADMYGGAFTEDGRCILQSMRVDNLEASVPKGYQRFSCGPNKNEALDVRFLKNA